MLSAQTRRKLSRRQSKQKKISKFQEKSREKLPSNRGKCANTGRMISRKTLSKCEGQNKLIETHED